MRRIINPNLVASLLQDRSQHIARRTLPIGSADVDGFYLILWISPVITEFFYIIQPWFVGFFPIFLIVGRLFKKPFQRLLIVLFVHL